MMDVLRRFSRRRTPQSSRAHETQIANAAGGYTFATADDAHLHRFLTLGTSGGTYYTSAEALTREAADVVFRAAATDPIRLVQRIAEVSEAGRAPKQNPALFALAIAASCEDVDGRRAACAALPAVARTGTHLFQFANYIEQFRGWGPALRRSVGSWYLDKSVDQLAHQVVKYRQRDGWTHRDLLRLAHPRAAADDRRALFEFVVRGTGTVELPAIVQDFLAAQAATKPAHWVEIVGRGHGLSWEMLPDAALNLPEVWEALLDKGVPQTALMRQLPRLTRLGLLSGGTGRAVAAQLQDATRLRSARVHPVNVLVAARTYASGRSDRGSSTWTPEPRIVDALDAAFYAAYGAVEPSGGRVLLALDVSGSMDCRISGMPLTCREASAALALVSANVETDYQAIGFTAGADWRKPVATRLDITARRRLDDVCRYTAALPMGGTDCALPMVWALKNRLEFDAIHLYTDNETWYGNIHPHQALAEYRQKMGIETRLVVVAMTGTRNTIADPSDPRQLDVSGFDSAVPQLLSDFTAGRL
ncbi:hypothetical protein CCUG63695_03724 [Mycobacteroides franklinii]|uniref:TROVE domain-containing protein n=2 Tax=Mycobacteroides franklinii TaxID=948102 RepID=A0A4R8R7V3_9MYCO|nr:hypothetical protein CCUG64054_03797 [Mycobacteroides franklinii]TDZ50868.1 hypothetical protein CCUG63697_02383 [Mycobacteroides franklinii]TDZ57288.1 hypothetical protein CCUG63696_03794 [Mycobacteroides franklinii]TDZ64229.1 hypothetical protein CCUG63695_03724 [Mycobacteroides franklinii]TDZ70626.1 hypothetical protein CCUG64056_03797 [Mycobacteroides franklinii]